MALARTVVVSLSRESAARPAHADMDLQRAFCVHGFEDADKGSESITYKSAPPLRGASVRGKRQRAPPEAAEVVVYNCN